MTHAEEIALCHELISKLLATLTCVWQAYLERCEVEDLAKFEGQTAAINGLIALAEKRLHRATEQ